MSQIDSLLAELDQESQTTQRLLERVPDRHLSWRPHPKSFSLGQLALHIASVPAGVATAASLDTFEVPNFALQPEASSRQQILDTFSQSLLSAKSTLQNIDDARLASTWQLTRQGQVLLSMPRISFLRSILLNHSYHHRGQLSVYLRLLDVPLPSIYGPTADESPFS